MTLASRLFSWRLYHKLTQQQLAEKSGLPQSAIAAIESGKLRVGLRRLQALEAALGLDAGALLSQDPARPVLDRFEMDAFCRALVAGKPKFEGVDGPSWKDFEIFFRTRLGLLNPARRCYSRGRASAARRRLDARWGREFVNQVDGRLRKFQGGQ
jgi:transcriptional regulator with XRE-family HTH domain